MVHSRRDNAASEKPKGRDGGDTFFGGIAHRRRIEQTISILNKEKIRENEMRK